MQAVNDKLVRLLKLQKLSRSDLARKLACNRALISQTLNDPDYNWTIDTLQRWASALGYDIEIRFVKRK